MIAISRITWDRDPQYEAGLDRGVFYPEDGPGEPWNGLVSLIETPSESDLEIRYIDGVKTGIRRKSSDFTGTIRAYSHPMSFFQDPLTQKKTKRFGLSYRAGFPPNFKIHLVYNVLVAPSVSVYDQQSADIYEWKFTSLPVLVPGGRRSSHLIIDTSIAYASAVEDLENILYGSDLDPSRLPYPNEVFEIFEDNSILKVTDNGDGTFTVDGPDEAIEMLDATTFQITWPSAIFVDTDTYTIHSL